MTTREELEQHADEIRIELLVRLLVEKGTLTRQEYLGLIQRSWCVRVLKEVEDGSWRQHVDLAISILESRGSVETERRD
ncbi:MAG: hypothetical protein HN341_14395 [Verrucomicrobia bacterium]|jgi:hypothetical protein|nr:hypothetical protein [Verrucomicrobiota bacterium]